MAAQNAEVARFNSAGFKKLIVLCKVELPRNPLGKQGCRVPTGIQLGGRNEWGFVNTSDVFTATFPSRPTITDRDFTDLH
ncbi:MAG: hypothetical protein RL616_1331, partial [Verrucomicrobiota bacterium]